MNEDDKQLTLAQWQTCVEMANAVSQRRDMTNNLFATLHLAVVGAITAISSFSNFEACVICILGIIFCVAWICIIDNFRILNTQKFHIITEIEKNLPNKPLTDEWENIKKTRYKLGSRLEMILPITFELIYAVFMIERLVSCQGCIV